MGFWLRSSAKLAQSRQRLPCTLKLLPYGAMDMSGLSTGEQQALEGLVAKKQMRDMLQLYSGLVERCFTSCVNDFTSKTLSTKEDECISRCADKFLAHSSRVGLRFSEQNAGKSMLACD